MGMAASQARLLSITARIHDLEFEGQSIQNAKLQLANHSDQAYEDYLEALDATTMTIATINNSGQTSTIPATFNNLCSKNRVQAADGSQYALRDSKGRLIVEDGVARAYDNFKKYGNDDSRYFALYMLNGESLQAVQNLGTTLNNKMQETEESIYSSTAESDKSDKLIALHQKLQELTGSSNIYDKTNVKKENLNEYELNLNAYKNELYKSHADKIWKTASNDRTAEDLDMDMFDYYARLYEQISSCGGCTPISAYNGIDGDAANNSDWLQAMVKCGKITIETVKTNKYGEISFNGTSPSSDTSLGYTQTTLIDETALAKAEAKYEHDLKEINKKDKAYDLSLAKLDTERSALTKEYESVQKVIEENIERSFGIFS